MNNKYMKIIKESCEFSNMDVSRLLESLNSINHTLKSIVYHDDTFSYDSYRMLLILNHNFRNCLDSSYLKTISNLSFLSYQVRAYYNYGGTEEILPYLSNLDLSIKRNLEGCVLQGKQQFVLSCFVKPYNGIPNEMKNFCEVPSFYPKVSDELQEKIYKKR